MKKENQFYIMGTIMFLHNVLSEAESLTQDKIKQPHCRQQASYIDVVFSVDNPIKA